MSQKDPTLMADVEAINKISIIPSILNVICRTTGMGFAVIAKVTEEKWIACSSRDEVNFGLKPGDELDIEKTFCRDVREKSEPVIIENASEDDVYCQHPIPKLYGFESYISVPIYKKNGTFFGTLCSLDRKPAKVKSPEVLEMFNLFTDLIAFHLDAIESLENSEQRLTEEQKTGELREQFIAILGHDLRNPVSTTRMGADILLQTSKEPGTQKIARLLKSTAYRMENLIGNILDFARGRLGDGINLDVHPYTEELEKSLKQIIAETEASWPEKTIKASIKIDQQVMCDKDRIAQLFSNLLGNAINHGDEEAPVTVEAFIQNGFFNLNVVNRGKKIPEKALQWLFQPFVRDEEKTKKDGLGLGLYIAHEIAKAHNGTLTVQSTDEKTRFTLLLPLL